MTAINTLYELIDEHRNDGDEREIERVRTVGELILEGREDQINDLERAANELQAAQDTLIEELDRLYWDQWITLERGE